MAYADLSLDHIAFPIFDVKRTHYFYTEVLGLPLVAAHTGDDWGGKEWLMMIFSLSDNRQLALVALKGARKPAGRRVPADSHHFAFSVTGNREFKAWQQKLRSANVEFSEEDHGTQRSIYFSDPNGYVIEITMPASSAEMKTSVNAARHVKEWIERTSSRAVS
jgi:glyoxylase I family protein